MSLPYPFINIPSHLPLPILQGRCRNGFRFGHGDFNSFNQSASKLNQMLALSMCMQYSRIFVFILCPSRQMLQEYFILSYGHFLSYPLQLAVHYHPVFGTALLELLTVSLHKQDKEKRKKQ
jgi:hypothetical protein